MMDHEKDRMICGIRPVEEAIASGKEIDRVLFRKTGQGEGFRELFSLIRKKGIPFQYVPDAKLHQLARQQHQGVVAFISAIEYQNLQEIIMGLFATGKEPFLLLLDRVTDVRNFGAIARTAECAGVDALIIPEKGAARINAESVKASAGALMRIPVCRVPNLIHCGTELIQSGLSLCSVTEKGNEDFHQATYDGPLCLILGSEEDGISAPLLKMSSRRLKIPQYGTIGSLNVSVAGGIILFEAARKRNLIMP